MALPLHSANSLIVSRNNVLKDFLPHSTSSTSRGAPRRANIASPGSVLSLCDLSQTPSGRSELDVNTARHFSRLTSYQFCKDSVLAGHHLLNLKARRSPSEQKLVCNAAASSASSSGAHTDFNSVTLLGRAFLQKDVQFVCAAVTTVLLAGANKILYKMALVPLSGYPLFLAQFNTIIYVFAYSSILLMRYRAGIVTKEMLAIPQGKFVMIGALEALGLAMSMASAALLPGAIIPVLAQVFLKSSGVRCEIMAMFMDFCSMKWNILLKL